MSTQERQFLGQLRRLVLKLRCKALDSRTGLGYGKGQHDAADSLGGLIEHHEKRLPS